MNFEFLWIDDDRLREFLMTSPDDLVTFPSAAVPDMGWRRTESLREYHARMTKPQLIQITNYEPEAVNVVGDNNQWPNTTYAFFVKKFSEDDDANHWCTMCTTMKSNDGHMLGSSWEPRLFTPIPGRRDYTIASEANVWLTLYPQEYLHIPCPPSKAWEIMLDQISQYREQRATRLPDRVTE